MATLIKGGTVYDGSGEPPRVADVLVKGKDIVRIASHVPAPNGAVVVDAKDHLVAPGFVDAANYADHYGAIAADPACTELVTRGITSIVMGQGGASLAPLGPHATIPESWWGNAPLHAAHPTTMGELFTLLRGRMGVNVGTLVGHATVREGVLRGTPRDLTDREFERLEVTLAHALAAGALGISVNLEYLRTARVPHHELLAAARLANDVDAVIALRLRAREERVKEAFFEALAVSEETKANLLITDLEPYASTAGLYRELLAHLTRESGAHRIHFTTAGNGMAAVPLPLFLPPHMRETEWHAMREHLNDRATREELVLHLKRYRGMSLMIASIADPSLRLFEGTPFAKWSLHEHLSFEDALIRLMEVAEFRATLSAGVGDRDLADAFGLHDRAFIASGECAAPSLELSPQLSFLGRVRALKAPLEQVIAKMTGGPARKFNLRKRGFVREGYRADLVVLEGTEVRETFVNGIRAVREGAPTAERGGEVLRREQ